MLINEIYSHSMGMKIKCFIYITNQMIIIHQFKRVERQFFFQDEGDLDKVGDFDR
jgi:hypothetical protein